MTSNIRGAWYPGLTQPSPIRGRAQPMLSPGGKGAVRLASTVMAQVGEILKILNLAKFQSIFLILRVFLICDHSFTFYVNCKLDLGEKS